MIVTDITHTTHLLVQKCVPARRKRSMHRKERQDRGQINAPKGRIIAVNTLACWRETTECDSRLQFMEEQTRLCPSARERDAIVDRDEDS